VVAVGGGPGGAETAVAFFAFCARLGTSTNNDPPDRVLDRRTAGLAYLCP